MSQKNKTSENGGYYIAEEKISTLEGKLLNLIEAMGLEKSQESAAKSVIRQEVWNLVPNHDYKWIDEADLKKLDLSIVWDGPGAPFINKE